MCYNDKGDTILTRELVTNRLSDAPTSGSHFLYRNQAKRQLPTVKALAHLFVEQNSGKMHNVNPENFSARVAFGFNLSVKSGDKVAMVFVLFK
jgi:hypothetical protein